jgi:O-antigen/teichoic acid export membrane protein
MTEAGPNAIEAEAPADNLKDKVLHGAKWSVVDKWMVRLFSLITFVLLGRMVAPEAFGLLALAATTISIFSVMFDGGSSEALIRRENLTKRYTDTAFWIAAGFGVVLATTCALGSTVLASIYDEPDLALILQVFAIAIVLNATGSTHASLLRRDFQFRSLAIRRIIGTASGGTVGVIWAIVDPGVWALVGQYMTSAVVSVAVLWFASPYRPSFQFDRAEGKGILKFGSGML